MTSNKFCCAMDIREVHEPVQSKLFSPLQQSGLDVTQLGLFSSTCQFTWLSYFSCLAGVLSPPAHWLALLLSVSASVSQPASIWEELSWESPSWFAVGTKICLIDIVKKDRICIHVGSSLLLTINQKRPHTNRPSNSLLARCSKLHDSRSLGKGKRLRRKRRQGRKGTNVWALRSVLLMQMSWSRTGFWLHPTFSWDQPLAWVTQTKFLLVYIYTYTVANKYY